MCQGHSGGLGEHGWVQHETGTTGTKQGGITCCHRLRNLLPFQMGRLLIPCLTHHFQTNLNLLLFTRDAFFSALNPMFCLVMLQVVETNLVAFDCHWILINEVSAMKMIHGPSMGVPSVHRSVSIIQQIRRVLDPEHCLGPWMLEEREELKNDLFHTISCYNIQNVLTMDVSYHFIKHLLQRTSCKNHQGRILYVLLPVIKDSHCIPTMVSEMMKVTLGELFWLFPGRIKIGIGSEVLRTFSVKGGRQQ